MMSRFSLFCLLLMATLEMGCHSRKSVPVLKPVARITARINEVPEWGLSPVDSIVVPQDQLPDFAKLVLPKSPCLQKINRDTSYHVADVTIEHPDGTDTKLSVFSTGHNPAAISQDNETFFYGDQDGFPDGATRIVRLLRDYAQIQAE